MSTSKRKWPGAGALSILTLVLIAAVVIAARRCAHHGSADRAGGNNDEHARMCAKRHPPFPRLTVQPGGGPGGEPRSTGLSPSQSDALQRKAARDGRAPAALGIESAKVSDGGALAGSQPRPASGSTSGDGPGENLTGDCSVSGCGVNGTWLGAGVPVRTLHLSPYRHNDINLSILEFLGPEGRDGEREPLSLQVKGDVMGPADPALPSLVKAGSVLRLGPPETPGGPPTRATYELTITKVHNVPFWIAKNCPQGSTDQGCQPETFPVYDFSARSLEDDCPLQVCAPGLDDDSDATNNLIGTAVIFEGDYYDDAYTVRIAPPSTYDSDAFNIACLGTTISKMHRFRHTSAARITPSTPPAPPVDRRQALLRLLTADYCGAGHPFTHDGVPLRINFDGQAVFGAPDWGPTAGSGFALWTRTGATAEAVWNADGATWIGQPRLEKEIEDMRDAGKLSTAEAAAAVSKLWHNIEETCRLVNHTVNRLVPNGGPVPPTVPVPAGSYVESQNPGQGP